MWRSISVVPAVMTHVNRQTIPIEKQRKFISPLRTEVKTVVQPTKTPKEGKTSFKGSVQTSKKQ